MEFKKYNSIVNTYNHRFLDCVYITVPSGETWVALEKIHGANYSFLVDPNQIKVAKRTSIISREENFFGHELIIDKYSNQIREIYNIVLEEYPDLEYVQVFGEIFGGIYDHPDVSKNKDIRHVQLGVYYTPEVDYMVFDIKVYLKHAQVYSNDTLLFYESFYLDWNKCKDIVTRSGMRHPPVIAVDKLENLLKLDIEQITSRVPEMYDLPEIENNIIEGIVMKPVHNNYYLRDKSRCILKYKTKRFQEVTANKNKYKKHNNDRLEYQCMLRDISRYITVNRLNNVYSKLGPDSDKGTLCKELIADAIQEYTSNLGEELENFFSKNEIKKMRTNLSKHTFMLISKHSIAKS